MSTIRKISSQLFLVVVLCSGLSPIYAQVEQMSSEPELIALLASDAPPADKAMACKRLAIFGSEQAVAELAKLLDDPQLASWSRIALEAIPGQAPNVALREAAGRLDGRLQIGVINSLGVRRDEAAVELLADQLRSATPEAAAAAALALGKIGTDASAAALRDFLPDAPASLRSAVAEGCIVAAERLAEAGHAEVAGAIYDQIRSGDFPRQRIVEATRGAILARGQAGVPLLIEQLHSPDLKLFAVGLQTARELSSDQLAPALIDALGQAPLSRAALIVEALGDLPGQVDLTALQRLATSGAKEVRLAAIAVLGRVGDASCLEPLLLVARQSDDLRAAVRAALVELDDDQVGGEILRRLPNANEDQLILLELVGLRQLEATDALVKALDHREETIRAAALQALGETIPQARLKVLVAQVLQPKHATDTAAAARALRTAAVRMPDREACAALLAESLLGAPTESKATLLEMIAAVGGEQALRTLGEYAQSSDEALRDASTRLLGEWMTIDVAPVLLQLASSGPADRFQVRAMRGYLRVARQFVMPEEQRIEMCRQALATARLAEQKLVMDVLKRYPSLGMLKLAIEAADQPGLKEDARQAAQFIGQKLADNPEAQRLIAEAGL